MKSSKYNEELIVGINAVRRAAQLTENVLQRIDAGMMSKEDKSPVTIADFGSQALICKDLRDKFPDDPVIGEESSAALQIPENKDLLDQVIRCVSKSAIVNSVHEVCGWIDHGSHDQYTERFWALDPIDGTKGFIRGDQYAIALALIISGQPVAAVIGCPKLYGGIIYVSTIDCGTHTLPLVGYEMNNERRVFVSKETYAVQARYCESVVASHSSQDITANVIEKLGSPMKPIRMDSQVKYGLVASGSAEIYLRIPKPEYIEKIWDHAAGQAIVEAAGGKVTDLDGRPLDYTYGREFKNNRGVMATNSLLHTDVLRAIRKVDEKVG
ncbi:MAG: 3'(2'),5'-bisphosphate nucleotidase [Promethearchaeota archaeon]|jgi:3'(2'), 5'-bisphosphate nucleotidase